MRNSLKKLAITAFLFVWMSTSVGAVNAAFLKFDQTSFDVNVDETFEVQIIVDPGSDEITSIDSYITYDSAVVNAQTVTSGTYFPTVLNDLTTGKIYVAGLVDSPSDFKTGAGTVATITFKAMAEGTTDLIYDCDGAATVTSKIIKNDINSTNIITCSQNGTAVITVSVGGTTSSTPTPDQDSTGGVDDTPTPTQAVVTELPASGSTENMMVMALVGTVLVGVGGLTKLFKLGA